MAPKIPAVRLGSGQSKSTKRGGVGAWLPLGWAGEGWALWGQNRAEGGSVGR